MTLVVGGRFQESVTTFSMKDVWFLGLGCGVTL